jgi:hypothetical protein
MKKLWHLTALVVLVASIASADARSIGREPASGGLAAAPPPVPVAVTMTPSSGTQPDTASSGTLLSAITVTMSDSSTFTGMLSENGTFTQITGSNLVLSRGLTGGDDGFYTITVTATQNSVSAQAPFSLTVSPPTPPGSNFITSTTVGGARADSSDLWRGFKLTVGSQPLTVTAMCRWVGTLNGSVHTHNLGIYSRDPVHGTGILMYGTGVTVDISGGTPNTYDCVSLSTNVILWPGMVYYVTSEEPGGGTGDTWYGNGSDGTFSTTADATMNNGGYYDPSDGFLVDVGSGGNHPLVPVNFQYNVGTPGANVTQLGSPYNINVGQPDVIQNEFLANSTPREASGANVLVHGPWYEGPPSGEVLTYQYRVWGSSGLEMLGPVLSETTGVGPGGGPTQVTASIAGTTMTVTAAAASTLAAGQSVTGANILPGTVITAGSGGVGSYSVTPSQTAASDTRVTVQGSDNSLPWIMDSTALTDGTKVIYPRILNATMRPVMNGQYAVLGRPTLVNNGTHNEGAQDVPVSSTSTERWNSPRPDIIHYDGVPNPIHTSYAFPYIAAPNGSNNALYRDPGQWYFGTITGTHQSEYHELPQWSSLDSGGGPGTSHGVLMTGVNPICEDAHTTPDAYNPCIKLNPSDGSRLNSIVSPFTNYLEDPTTSGKWWFNEITGRIGTIDRNGTVTTVAGFRRNKSNLTYPQQDANPDSQEADNFETVGAFPPGDDCGGANDMVFDPRDGSHRTLYVACQVDNWIEKVNLTTTPATVTIFAGSPGAPGSYTGDGGAATSATFNSPNSIIMDNSGNMYVSDQANSAIRKIDTSNNISTVYGGNTWTGWAGHGSVPLSYHDMNSANATYNVSTTSWNSGTQLLTVVMDGLVPTNAIGPGYSLQMSGATNSGGSGDPNIVWTVQAAGFGDSNHFVLAFPPNLRPHPSTIGTLTGTIMLSRTGADVYSSPTSVGVTTTGGQVVQPSRIQFTSNGNIVVFEGVTFAARLINLNTADGGVVGQISRIGSFDGEIGIDQEPQWMWGDVDYTGSEGPLNDIFMWKFQCCLSAAHHTWRTSLAGNSIGQPTYQNVAFSDNSLLPTWGSFGSVRQGSGHYPWAVALSRSEGKLISTGTANLGPILIQITSDATQPPVDPNTNTNVNSDLYGMGFGNHILGTGSGFPGDVRPSLWSLRGPFGTGYILNTGVTDTYEDLMHGSYASTTPGDTGDQNLLAFIQGGAGGAVPRPEFSSNGFGFGNEARDLIYFIRRSTLQGGARATPVLPGATNPDNAPPAILTLSVNRTSTTAIQAIFTTDKSTICLEAGGSTFQSSQGSYPLFTDLDTFGTSHNLTLTVPLAAIISPVVITAVCQDQAGNYSHSTPVSVP